MIFRHSCWPILVWSTNGYRHWSASVWCWTCGRYRQRLGGWGDAHHLSGHDRERSAADRLPTRRTRWPSRPGISSRRFPIAHSSRGPTRACSVPWPRRLSAARWERSCCSSRRSGCRTLLVPALIGIATLIFAFGRRIRAADSRTRLAIRSVAMRAIGPRVIYGGYFGALE